MLLEVLLDLLPRGPESARPAGLSKVADEVGQGYRENDELADPVSGVDVIRFVPAVMDDGVHLPRIAGVQRREAAVDAGFALAGPGEDERAEARGKVEAEA